MTRTITIATLTTAATADVPEGGEMCQVGKTCEGVHAVADQPAHYYVIVSDVTDPDELAAFASYVGRGERLGRIERRHIDGVPR